MTPTETILAAQVPGWIATLLPYLTLLQGFLWPVLTGVAWYGIALLQKHGYQTTYAAAIVRAVGAGVNAAQANGLDPLSSAGRLIVAKAGAEYLAQTVGTAASKLGITTMDDHAARVDAQMGAMVAAGGSAALSAVAAEVTSAIPGQGTLNNILGDH